MHAPIMKANIYVPPVKNGLSDLTKDLFRINKKAMSRVTVRAKLSRRAVMKE